MNKVAMVVGGANGVGAGITKKLLSENYKKIYVVDIAEPVCDGENVEFIKFDLINDDVNKLKLTEETIDTLVITAGIGRLNYFDTNSLAEIEKTFKINAISVIEIIKVFYDRINSDKDFYCAVMSSIAGMVASPLYAVYSASKGAVTKFVEAINAELSGQGRQNRILSVAPGSIKGTKFHGGNSTDFDSIAPLVNDIYDSMVGRKELFIPNGEVYDNVLKRYRDDAVKFANESYEYKLKGSLEEGKKTTVGYLTGSFDLFHVGHLNLLRRAKAMCDYLVVGVHTDGSHKGKELFIPLEERIAIVEACKYVDRAMECSQSDLDAYDEVRYDYLFVGSDYKGTERFENYEKELAKVGSKVVYFPYTKGTSSTQLRDKLSKKDDK